MRDVQIRHLLIVMQYKTVDSRDEVHVYRLAEVWTRVSPRLLYSTIGFSYSRELWVVACYGVTLKIVEYTNDPTGFLSISACEDIVRSPGRQ